MRVVMMGTGSFAEPTLVALLERPGVVVGLVTQPDRDVGKLRHTTRQGVNSMKVTAEKAGIPVIQPATVNAPEGVEALRHLRPDLLVVGAYGQILSPEVLAIPRLGGINVHASLLPKYRGAAPIAWAIWNGETQTGVTIIRMSAGLDAGDILAREALDIFPDETAGELEARLAPLGARLALQIVERLAAGEAITGEKQNLAQVTRAPKLKKEMGLIDWTKPAGRVWNQIRAMQPWPSPYTFLHRPGHKPLRVIVNDAAPVESAPKTGQPGDVSADRDVSGEPVLLVAAGEGTGLRVLSIQPAGKRAMTAAEFLRGHPIQPGDRFAAEVTPESSE